MISVIVPVYKAEPYLRQCVDSILEQTYRDIEVLLIDDGSPDKCGEICDEYAEKDNRVRTFHTENRGVSAARNLGISESKGEYIGFVDSDDWIEPDMYETLLKRMQEVGADIAQCGVLQYPNRGSEKSELKDEVLLRDDALRALIESRVNNYVWNKLYNSRLFETVTFPDGMNYEDAEIIHKLLSRSNKTALVSAGLYHYRIRQGSITKTFSAKNLIDYADVHFGRYRFFKEYEPDLFREEEDLLLQYAAQGVSRVWRWWHGCSEKEKAEYEDRIKEFALYSKSHFPLFGYNYWPKYLRVSAVFMHSSSAASFAVLYFLNQAYRRIQIIRGKELPV